MHAGRRYSLREFILWTRRDIFRLFVLAVVPTVLYAVFDFTFLSISWVPIGLIGTAVAFIVGFKNNATYDRLWEARQIWGGIINTSRAFAAMVRDFLGPEYRDDARQIFYRHFAWLTALRYGLREPRAWENLSQPYNREYARTYSIPEHELPLEEALRPYLSPGELAYILPKKNKTTQIAALQSAHLARLKKETLTEFQHQQLQSAITDLYDQQGRAERIKNFPYPRNFSSIASILLYVLVLLVPFGLLNEFSKMGADTFLEGYTVWFNIPFATLVTWVFVALDRVGESSANPFEGGANDVPISTISRTIEIDLRDMLDEENLPAPLMPKHSIQM